MVRLQTLDLRIGVRVPASQPHRGPAGWSTRARMWCGIAMFLFPLCVCAQEKAAPPPELDKALRERAQQFIQYSVDGNFKRAYEFVAEETKDWYLSSSKPQYAAFLGIESVEYSDDFQHAKVKAKITRVVDMQGRQVKTDMAVTDEWKFEDGKWMWFHDPNILVTPFGEIKIDRSKMGAASAANAGPAPVPSDVSPEAVAAAASKLTVKASISKREISFANGKEASDEVVYRNGVGGAVTLIADIVGDYKSFSVEPKRIQVAAGKDAVFKVHYHPSENLYPASVRLTLEPFERETRIPIKILDAPEASH